MSHLSFAPINMISHLACRPRVKIPLSLWPSCVTRKKTARKKCPRKFLKALARLAPRISRGHFSPSVFRSTDKRCVFFGEGGCDTCYMILWVYTARGPFLESPGNFSGPERHSKISNLTITEPFYSRILTMNRGSLHTGSFRRIHPSLFRYRWTKNLFTGPKSFRGFRETGPRSRVISFVLLGHARLWKTLAFVAPHKNTAVTRYHTKIDVSFFMRLSCYWS